MHAALLLPCTLRQLSETDFAESFFPSQFLRFTISNYTKLFLFCQVVKEKIQKFFTTQEKLRPIPQPQVRDGAFDKAAQDSICTISASSSLSGFL